MGKLYGMLQAMDTFETTNGKGHDHCPKCGAVNGPFERMGSGTCNECLDKEVKRRSCAACGCDMRYQKAGQKNARKVLCKPCAVAWNIRSTGEVVPMPQRGR